MSTTYTDLTETKFPDELDTMTRLSDLNYTNKDLAIQYYAYKNAGNDSAAAQLLLDNPTLNTMILNAAKINKYQDIALALERFFKNDVEGYLEARFTYKEAYDPEITYVKGNIIDSNGEGFICRVDSSIGESPTPHTNNDNWAIIAKQGIQGVSGTGLSPRGVWDNTITYYTDDCVAYNNILWQCLIENTGSEPTNSNTNWVKLFDTLSLLPCITITAPIGSTVTATKGTTVITSIENPTGVWAIDIPDYGDWKIEAIRDTQYTKQIVSVQIVQNYTIELAYATITATAPIGSTITATKGETVITSVENPTGIWVFDIPSYGDWIVKATLGADSAEEIVSVQEPKNYAIELAYIDLVFANNTLEQIIQAADTNKIPDSWQIGDTKSIEFNNGDTVDVQIIGKNRESVVDGETASLVLGFVDCYENKRMNATNTNVGGWTNSEMRNYCNGDLFDRFPDILKHGIKKVTKKTSAGNKSTSIVTTEDYLWLLSATEVFPSPSSSYSPGGEGELFPIFTDNASRIKNLNGSPQSWWLRSPYVSSGAYFCRVSASGTIVDYLATSTYGVVLGFAI